jgi:UDP-glucose 4-epimerase
VLIHCAGTSLVGPSVQDPREYYNNNIVKTITLLDSIVSSGNKTPIIFSSSASVYGIPKEIPINETHQLSPISPYGNTKLAIEMLLKDYCSAYGISSTIFRYFNAAGAQPDTHDLGQETGATHIIARCLEAYLNNQKFIINGEGYQTKDGTCVRDYVHVYDIAQAHLLATDYMKKNFGCHVFNLGSQKGVSNLTIARYMNKHYKMSYGYGPIRVGDPDILVADPNRAKKILKWQPKYSTIEQIIKDAHVWYTKKHT